MKKRLVIFLSLLIAIVFTGGTVWACYSDRKSVWPDNILNMTLFSADLVIEGTIVDEGNRTSVITFGLSDGVAYKVAVDDVWFGSCEEETIKVRMPLNYTLPRENDKLVLILVGDDGKYRLRYDENSVFIKNPPFNLLFSLSPVEDCMIYDGETAGKLKSDMKKALRRLARKGTDIRYAIGEVSAPYKEKYLARHPEEGQK